MTTEPIDSIFLLAVAKKNAYGNLQCKSKLDLDTKHVIEFTTCKRCSGDLITSVGVWTVDGSGIMTRAPFSDFGKNVCCTQPARATKKYVENQHNSTDVKPYILEALEFYKIDIAEFNKIHGVVNVDSTSNTK